MIFAFDGRTPVIGADTYVSPTAQVIGDVRIGAGCYIGHGAILRGDYGTIVIGDGTAVEEGVIIHAAPDATNCIGSRVTLGHGAILHGARLGDGCLVGMGAVVSLSAVVGENTIIAEGCVVRQGQEVPGGVLVGGIPAKVIRPVTEKDLEGRKASVELYIGLAKKYLTLGMEPLD